MAEDNRKTKFDINHHEDDHECKQNHGYTHHSSGDVKMSRIKKKFEINQKVSNQHNQVKIKKKKNKRTPASSPFGSRTSLSESSSYESSDDNVFITEGDEISHLI